MFRAFHRAFANFRAHRGFFLASGLSFSLLTCLIPILFFIVSLAGFVLSRKAAMDAVLNQLAQIVPVYKNEMRQALEQIIRRRNLSGLVGTVILLLFASQLFGAVRLVLNDIFGFTRGPGILRGMLKDVVLLFLMGVLFLVSIVITDIFGWLNIILLTPIRVPPEWVQSAFIGLALAINTLLFLIAYRYFPHRKIPVGAALAGALLAAVLWETAKQLFRWYILSMGVYDRVYGPLGALVALTMFAYYSGVVFILGAEFTAALVNGRRSRA
ncbi:MAG TPA: YihY/virulence factor BrkB family protein [Methylomirabilota bacterium]|nr:YihY/virulence factor BrkB family protein [Methylomirabilota bacterium]